MCWDLMYGIHTMNHILLWIFIYLFSVSDLNIYKLPSCCFLFILRWNTRAHTHTSVKLHWDTKCHNPNNPVQVNCWQTEDLRCWLPIRPSRQPPPCFCFSWASSVSRVLCRWNEVFSAAGPGGCSPPPVRGVRGAGASRPPCCGGPQAHEALHAHPPPCRRVSQRPSWQLRYIKQS